ncbi:RagB/SusD family nutrient uptake outer membrane protein [Lepagella muris]|uniref:RagB/SusD family nutrient uptake outer membrane protein n=1 Tax=Lepagella muris TaxID=3032870 RepID=A0AC61RBI7_9BACT|nr:RagB/SusD family nutrient uptake outer membrane protein [Lepagella muris]TGY77456.1 RagB/SusD family nutrient uptake outer membrane protein [Lepagella muris]THG50143.1 RagB/SusD family nutrient uptake outer membrane protein [Bacteroidales bacterium]TKC60480.1 RagB/SusD family nutrient uptake outer membrane protein [Bacteroidales bacterium]
MKKIILSAILGATLLTSCQNMDIPPKNIVTSDDLLSSESGMDIYMARMYSIMPFEDFKYLPERGISNFNGWLAGFGFEGIGENVNRDGYCRSFTGEGDVYWGKAFELLRDANFLIENLPNYRGTYPEITYNDYLGEAYFVRAYVFYALAKRFGGIPLVTRVINYPAETDLLEVPRASEEETWDQICADFDKAIELMMPKSPKRGYANKYVALAVKSQAMLYAGSVAKYNETVPGRLTGLGQKTGVRVIGFDAATAAEASKRYFTEAYKAANEVIQNGGYSLYKKKWAEGDREAIRQNMIDMISDTDSPENIWIREYLYPTTTHSFDAYNAPYVFRSPLSSAMCPTADFVELFEGFDRYPDGSLKVTTGNSNSEGTYIMYDNIGDFYKNAEPRLLSYLIIPGDQFKGQKMEIYAGVYTGTTPVRPLLNDYSYQGQAQNYQNLDIAKGDNPTLYMTPDPNNHKIVKLPDGSEMKASGANGPFYNFAESAMTGLLARKWLKDDPSFTAREGNSDQHYILVRYAEVLLNAAEAAVELSLAGVASPDGSDMLGVATDVINDIRSRAGATLLSGKLTGSIESRNEVRKERRKEIAMETNIKWDLRRWRVQDYDNRDGFWGETRDKDKFSSNSHYRFRGIYPFYSAQDKKWFYDVRFECISHKEFDYNTIDYYFSIPGGEVVKSPVIDQQPNR